MKALLTEKNLKGPRKENHRNKHKWLKWSLNYSFSSPALLALVFNTQPWPQALERQRVPQIIRSIKWRGLRGPEHEQVSFSLQRSQTANIPNHNRTLPELSPFNSQFGLSLLSLCAVTQWILQLLLMNLDRIVFPKIVLLIIDDLNLILMSTIFFSMDLLELHSTHIIFWLN